VKPFIVYVIGATNAGKSTLMDAVKNDVTQGTVEVGKMMRAKYPPEHFAGQSNPAHTAVEAWQMYLDGIAQAEAAGKQAVWVDGQPRDMAQLAKVTATSDPRLFVHLWAPAEIREERARTRDAQDPAKLALSLTRLNGDLPALYNILTTLLLLDEPVLNVRSFQGFDPAHLVQSVRGHAAQARAKAMRGGSRP
jgi:cytidylate kinase